GRTAAGDWPGTPGAAGLAATAAPAGALGRIRNPHGNHPAGHAGTGLRHGAATMIELYAFPTPNGHKITIAPEELALPYRIVPINIVRGDQFCPEFLAISPNTRIPAIVDTAPADGGAPLPVFESGAILIYLAEKTGQLLPTELRARKSVLEWLMWQMGGAGPMLGQAHHFRRFAP